jgi:hypothetical protein
VISYRALFRWEGLGNAEVFLVGFALVGMLTFSPADFDINLGAPFSFSANDIAHASISPNIWYINFYLPLNMPIVKGRNKFFYRKIVKFKEFNKGKIYFFLILFSRLLI